MEHPEELSKVAGLQKKVDEVKNVMVDNIEQVAVAPHCSSPHMHAIQCVLYSASQAAMHARRHMQLGQHQFRGPDGALFGMHVMTVP
jgi:hypothetical protein